MRRRIGFVGTRLMDRDPRLALEAVPALAAVKEDFSSAITFFERFTGAAVRSSGGA